MTEAQEKVLKLIAGGRDIVIDYKYGNRPFLCNRRISWATINSLQRQGFITSCFDITPAGRVSSGDSPRREAVKTRKEIHNGHCNKN